jgi:hypothetical protein
MVMGKMTILGLLKKQNKIGIKSIPTKKSVKTYWTLLEKDFMIQTSANAFIHAQKIISRAFRRMKLRKLARKHIFIADIYYEADPDIAKEIFLVGEFSAPEWAVQIWMKYSFFHRAFLCQVKIQGNWQFKFIVDGTFVWWPQYTFKYTKEKFVNNIFDLNNINRKHFSSPFKKMGNMNGFLSSKREQYLRKKNNEIFSRISNFECGENKLLADSIYHTMPYFSPDVNIAQRRMFNQQEILGNSLWDSRIHGSQNLKIKTSQILSSNIHVNGARTNFYSSPKYVEDRIMKTCRDLRYITTHNISRTPLQKILNPLRSLYLDEYNKSHQDEGSEYSEDDFMFLNEYFNNIPYTPHGKLELTPGCLR